MDLERPTSVSILRFGLLIVSAELPSRRSQLSSSRSVRFDIGHPQKMLMLKLIVSLSWLCTALEGLVTGVEISIPNGVTNLKCQLQSG